MPLTSEDALQVLREAEFYLYHAKSSNESLLIHSFSVYSLVDQALRFTQTYSETEKELMRWAALLHDYGKTAHTWQKAKRGPHRVSLGDIKYEELHRILEDGLKRFSGGLLAPPDIEDILFIIEFHHGSGRAASTPSRNRMKDVVSECDQAVSQSRISEDLVRTLNTVIDTVRYRLFTIELIEHPISPLVIGAFDYALQSRGISPLLYSPTSTLYAGVNDVPLPPLDEVNQILNDQIGLSQGVLRFDGGNGRIFTEERSFLELASDPDRFISDATAYANNYCARKRKSAEKNPDAWSDEQEEIYLYGRVCGTTYNTILDLCKASDDQYPRACLMAGGRHGKVTVLSMQILGLRGTGATYVQTLRKVLEKVEPLINKKLRPDSTLPEVDPGSRRTTPGRYDVTELLVPDTSAYGFPSPLDPKAEALKDYENYWNKDPLRVCPTCNHFPQGNVSAAFFSSAFSSWGNGRGVLHDVHAAG